MEAVLRRPCLVFLLFVLSAMAVTCLLYFPSLNAFFVLDDFVWLEKVSVDRLISYFYGPWGHATAYRPLMRLSFLSDYLMFGDHPLGWHLHSYFIHACNAVILFLIIRLLTGQLRIAGLVSLFFILSPLGYENVVWISARVNTSGSFFYLSGLYFYLKYMLPDTYFDDSENHHIKHSTGDENSSSRSRLVISFILFSLGLLTYEAVVSFPVLLCLLFITHGRLFRFKAEHQVYILSGFIFWLGIFLVFRYFALGKTIGSVAGHWPNYFYGLTQNVPELFLFLYRQFKGRDIIILLLLVTPVMIIVRKQYDLFKYFLYILLATLILYLPFSMVSAVTYRYLYLVQVPYLLLAACIFFYWLGAELKIIRYAVLILLLWVVFSNIERINTLSNEWRIAGTITKSIPEQVKKLYPQKDAHVDFAFLGIPDAYRHAGVFLTYFEKAIARKYTDFDGNIFKNTFLIPADNERVVKYFAYEQKTGKLSELSKKEWESLYFDRDRIHKSILELRGRNADGSPGTRPGNITLDNKNLMISLEGMTHAREIQTDVDGGNDYLIIFFKETQETGRTGISLRLFSPAGLSTHILKVPEKAVETGYNKLLIIPAGGDSLYSVGHLRIKE